MSVFDALKEKSAELEQAQKVDRGPALELIAAWKRQNALHLEDLRALESKWHKMYAEISSVDFRPFGGMPPEVRGWIIELNETFAGAQRMVSHAEADVEKMIFELSKPHADTAIPGSIEFGQIRCPLDGKSHFVVQRMGMIQTALKTLLSRR